MASTVFESDSESEEFEGFRNSDIERNDVEQDNTGTDSESDISISTVNTEDLSDFSVSDDEEVDEEWNSSREAVNVRPFQAPFGPISGVAEDGTAIDFFHLMFPEELFTHIVEETNLYASSSALQ